MYVVEFAVTCVMATVFLLQSFPFSNSVIHWVSVVGASLLYILASYRFFTRIFFNEQLVLDTQYITLVKKTFLSRQVNRYDWKHIGEMHFEAKTKKVGHPLKGKYFDYFGFDAPGHFVRVHRQEGILYFDTYDGRIYFAGGVSASDAEKLVQIMKLYLGAQLKLGPEWKEMLQEQEMDDTMLNN